METEFNNIYLANAGDHNDDDFRKNKIHQGVYNGLRDYKEFLRKCIDVIQKEGSIKVDLKRENFDFNDEEISLDNSKNETKKEIRFYLNTDSLNDRDEQKAENEIFKREVRKVYKEKPNGDPKLNKKNEIDVIGRNEEQGYVILDTDENPEYIYLKADDYQLRKQISAIKTLMNQPLKEHTALQKLFDLTHKAEAYYKNNIDSLTQEPEWKILKDPEKFDGTDEQREFVRKALQTNDFALLEGPPGSGKTTAIIELIIQLVKQNKRVLLVSATHVAVDNVFDRILNNYKNVCEGLVVPIRISSDIDSIRKESVKKFRLQNFVKNMKYEISENLRNDLSSKSKTKLYQSLTGANNKNVLDGIILESANLVAGTMIGILQHPDIKKGRVEDMFDVMIVDESSKVTFTEFLVPALYAKKWILVGDVNQLSPYVEEDHITEIIDSLLPEKKKKEMMKKLTFEKNNNEWKETVASLLNQMYQYRFDSEVGEAIKSQLDALIPDKIKDEIEKIRRIAFPSILELLQIGIGEKKDRHGNILNTVLYQGFNQFSEFKKRKFQSLSYQHRIHDDIAEIPRKYFYKGKNLKTANTVFERKDKLAFYKSNEEKVTWVTNNYNVFRNKDNSGRVINDNHKEVNHIKSELRDFIREAQKYPEENFELAVLTFYRAQERKLRKMLKGLSKQYNRTKYFVVKNVFITLSTVDRFQGDEADMVLLSFTKATKRAFYNNLNRLNVALTRGRFKLVLFGNRNRLMKDAQSEALKELAKNYTQRIKTN